MPKRRKLSESGFIVHPFETGDSKYHASYGSHNKTVKRFKTFGEAKAYLAKHKITKALYDHPSGPKDVKIVKKVALKPKRRTARRKSIFDMDLDDLF